MVYCNSEGMMDGGQKQQQQEQRRIANRPQTVSSLSSIDTAGYDQSDTVNIDPNNVLQSALAALPPLPSEMNMTSEMEVSGSSSTVVSSTTTSAAATASGTSTGLADTNYNTYIGGNNTSSISTASTPAVAIKQEPVSVPAPSAIHLVGTGAVQISPSTGVLITATPNTNTVPEFLYQLTKMLTDNNRDIIEWSNGKIEVHSPHKLESHVLNRYFRHSKFASFQRQLNYFGFRKLAGKGKMAPCSYVNDATTDELGSLLLIKRKQGNELKTKAGGKKRARSGKEGKSENPASSNNKTTTTDPVNPVLAGILYHSTSSDNVLSSTGSNTNNNAMQQSQKAIARVAVGKGVRHGYVPHQSKNRLTSNSNASSSNSLYSTKQQQVPTTTLTTSIASSPLEAGLNALTQNFNQSMHETIASIDANGIAEGGVPGAIVQTHIHEDTNTNMNHSYLSVAGRVPYVPGSLHRDDSLVDLAMIPMIGDGNAVDSNVAASTGFSFVDFPFDSNIFSNEDLNI
mmetsp:Transcript_17174/g.37569  ORF Transcript_17174/g.37569 Transcript_17174/m.37569 type:complete len:513 (-) Transcript_17174:390-1928(-)